jgi:hypothetical protein
MGSGLARALSAADGLSALRQRLETVWLELLERSHLVVIQHDQCTCVLG